MAWLYKQPESENWFIGYRHNGKQKRRTTGTADRKQAEKELVKVQTMMEHHRTGTLTDELFQALTGSTLPKITLAAELEDWLAECRVSTAEKTVLRYQSFADEFKQAMDANASAPLLSAVTTDDLRRFLNAKRAATSAGTANLCRKTLSAIFIRAVKNHHLRQNPVSPIKAFKHLKGEKVLRRGYSLKELAAIHDKAPNEFWRYMVVGSFYTGLRMGDLCLMQRRAVDLQKDMLVLNDDKTDKPMHIPISKPFRAILAGIIARSGNARPTDYLWPDEAARYQAKGSGPFSKEFYADILTPLQLVTPRSASHKSTGNGHAGKRQVNEVSFHSLRHSFISFLRSTGSGQAVAKELAGHSSDHVNDLYTHLPEDVLQKAINLLPEIAI